VPRIPSTDEHAELAVSLYTDLLRQRDLTLGHAWQAVAQVLMSTQVWDRGEWHELLGELVMMERNNYRLNKDGSPNRALRDAKLIGDHLAQALGVSRETLPAYVGLYFRVPEIAPLQPNNLRGHAFRSIVAETLARYGDPALTISEELPVRDLFPGWDFGNRSDEARVDLTARRQGHIVALVSTRWTYRHDRVDMIDEARAYVPAARNANRNAVFFGVTAEIGTARLRKVINETVPLHPNAAIKRLVHLNPALASTVIKKNGPLGHMWSLADFVNDSWNWH
jgi:hypothetical protein